MHCSRKRFPACAARGDRVFAAGARRRFARVPHVVFERRTDVRRRARSPRTRGSPWHGASFS